MEHLHDGRERKCGKGKTEVFYENENKAVWFKHGFRRYGEMGAALGCGALAASAWILQGADGGLSIWLYAAAYLAGGLAKGIQGIKTLLHDRDLDVNLLMLLAAAGAATIGNWTEGAVLIFIFALSGALESYTGDRSRRDLTALASQKPETATLFRDGKERLVSAAELVVGDLILVRPGEHIPADGIVTEGVSSVNEAAITGEAIPADKEGSDEVFAGTLNGEGALFIEVRRAMGDTFFCRIMDMVKEAQSEKPKSQVFMETFERRYARIIVAVAIAVMLIPPLLFGWPMRDAFYKSMVFLVVASPCALVASIMPVVLSALSRSARSGVLFKGGAHLENAAAVRVVAFDKTGTLTEGQPSVTDVIGLGGRSAQRVLEIASSLESLSEHPLAKAIVRHAEQGGITPRRPASFRAYAGMGVEAEHEGTIWRVGKPAFAARDEEVPAEASLLLKQGKTCVMLHDGESIAGVIGLQDVIRPAAKEAVGKLQAMGITVVMLTGDQEAAARAVAAEAGIREVYAGLLPQQKAEAVKALKEKHGAVAMVGDGINDAPALATATVGIAMGAGGSDAALESADVVLLGSDIAEIPVILRTGRKAKAVIRQNLLFALSVIAVLLIGNFGFDLSLPLGVIGHEGSTLLVVLNGLRLLRRQ